MKEKVKAEDLYKELPLLKKEDVREIQQWILEHPDFPKTTEESVIRFHYATTYNMEKTKEFIQNYYKHRLYTLVDVFSKRDVLLQELQLQKDIVDVVAVPEKDPNGNLIIVQRLKVFDPSVYNLVHAYKLGMMLIDALLLRDGAPKGFITLIDSTGLSFRHILRLKAAPLKYLCQYVQKGCPIRLNEIHVVNTIPVIHAILRLLKPFLGKEISEKLHFHTGSFDEIEKFIPLNCLPCDYGGTQPSVDEIKEEHMRWLLELRDQFLQDDEEDRQFVEMRKNAKAEESKSKKSWKLF